MKGAPHPQDRAGSSDLAGQGLPGPEWEILQKVQQLRYYSRGATLAEQGEPAHGLFINRSASLKLFYLHASGKYTAVSFIQPGGVICLVETLLNLPYQRTAKVIKEGELHYVAKKDFVQSMLASSALAAEMLLILSRHAQDALQKLIGINCDSPERRLLRTLLEIGGPARTKAREIHFDLPGTVQDLADSIGCSRQWTSKILKETAERGLIRRKKRSFVLSQKALDLLTHHN